MASLADSSWKFQQSGREQYSLRLELLDMFEKSKNCVTEKSELGKAAKCSEKAKLLCSDLLCSARGAKDESSRVYMHANASMYLPIPYNAPRT